MSDQETDLQPLCITPQATLRDALTAIDRGGAGACMMVDQKCTLIGIITDGDARRAVLADTPLDAPAIAIATRSPHVVDVAASRAHVLDLMQAVRLSEIPVLDQHGRLVGLHTLSRIIGKRTLPNVAVIMAGGRGTRLGELTSDRPKPLMTVAGRAILDWIVLNLVGGGIRQVYVSVNYLAHQVEEHLGDGSHLGCQIHYLRENWDQPLGTAGSLALLRAERDDLVDPIVVMNGDLMTQFSVQTLLSTHRSSGAAITVGLRSYEHQVPFGVIETDDDGTLRRVVEKPTWQAAINAGIYAVSPAVLTRVPADRPSTMVDLVEACLDDGCTVGTWSIESDWIDVGTPRDLARAKGHE